MNGWQHQAVLRPPQRGSIVIQIVWDPHRWAVSAPWDNQEKADNEMVNIRYCFILLHMIRIDDNWKMSYYWQDISHALILGRIMSHVMTLSTSRCIRQQGHVGDLGIAEFWGVGSIVSIGLPCCFALLALCLWVGNPGNPREPQGTPRKAWRWLIIPAN